MMSYQCLPCWVLNTDLSARNVRSDLTFERPTVDEGPTGDDGPGTPGSGAEGP
jgi:hypothetical protein